MSRKLFAFILSAALLLLFCAGCGENVSPPAGSPGPDGGTSAPGEQGEQIQLTEEHKAVYAELLWPLAHNGTLMEEPEILEEGATYDIVQDLEVTDAVLEEDTMTLTAVLYGIVRQDPETGTEAVVPGGWLGDSSTIRSPEDDPHAPYIPLGTATVKLRGKAAGQDVLSCDWKPIENPGRAYLEAQTQGAAAEIAASGKADLSGYDPRVVDCVYQAIRSRRLIESPGEITLWDLENLSRLELYGADTSDPDTGAYTPDPLPLDAGLLRQLPNLRSCLVGHPLADYSVFEGMDLDTLTIHTENETIPLDLSTLQIGHVKRLSVEAFRQNIALDLSQSKVDTLYIDSPVAAVTEFRGCDGVRELEFRGTRSDTSILNASNFPDLEVLQMDFFSDYARFRDLSRLATFGEDVEIDLTLSYQACNSRTVATLDGVRLNSLTLDPKNGQWPLDEPDPALVERVRADRVEWRS